MKAGSHVQDAAARARAAGDGAEPICQLKPNRRAARETIGASSLLAELIFDDEAAIGGRVGSRSEL